MCACIWIILGTCDRRVLEGCTCVRVCVCTYYNVCISMCMYYNMFVWMQACMPVSCCTGVSVFVCVHVCLSVCVCISVGAWGADLSISGLVHPRPLLARLAARGRWLLWPGQGVGGWSKGGTSCWARSLPPSSGVVKKQSSDSCRRPLLRLDKGSASAALQVPYSLTVKDENGRVQGFFHLEREDGERGKGKGKGRKGGREEDLRYFCSLKVLCCAGFARADEWE